MTDYRATPEDWELQSKWASDCQDARCLLELRARAGALEDDGQKQAESIRFCFDEVVKRIEKLEANSKPTPRKIRSSLVERVMTAIERADGDDEARAAIREVLSYLCEHELIGNYARQQLKQEVEI